jgi:hypothetical protein
MEPIQKSPPKAVFSAMLLLLKQHGFTHQKAMSAWRYDGERVDVVEVRKFLFKKPQWNLPVDAFEIEAGIFLKNEPNTLGNTIAHDRKGLPSRCHRARRSARSSVWPDARPYAMSLEWPPRPRRSSAACQ